MLLLAFIFAIIVASCFPPLASRLPQELGKQPGSMLAPRLQIGSEEYEDLDEILSRRVSACNDLVNDLIASEKVVYL